MFAASREPKGSLVTVPVVVKGQELISYVMRMGETMPPFNYWPRGREIIQRLVLRAALADNLEEFKLFRTSEEAIQSIIFNRKQTYDSVSTENF